VSPVRYELCFCVQEDGILLVILHFSLLASVASYGYVPSSPILVTVKM
jgi:hypothetical protein